MPEVSRAASGDCVEAHPLLRLWGQVVSVWVAIPSARPVAEVNAWRQRWCERGYAVAIQRDPGKSEGVECDALIERPYQGYAEAVNYLVRHVLKRDPTCDWIVATGDDTLPDPSKRADEIGEECTQHFALKHGTWRETFGIMQPTGHRWGENDPHSHAMWPNAPAYIDRICGSPWLGREWCLRGNQGAGPFHPGFWHMHGDECLQETAKKLGILWQRRDLTHFHDHWGLTGNTLRMPEFLAKANSPEHWRESKALLERLRAADFAECMPI